MKNIVIHNWKGYKKAQSFTTYGFVSIFKEDIFHMFDRGAKKIEKLLGYNIQSKNVTVSIK